ncbi:hypothetical protein LS684_19445 [Cytobacillus spongiae]|uniref:hypothetical protein n=1 Tax=Cytobacillus spongiae TaxID=2901381 RepID=UPI001F1B235F|nr:hypothetical protein [Cytobacillus spongiae]UII55772.1 hypothetical protein LS684_19445 [Cytobacillus spongiae]
MRRIFFLASIVGGVGAVVYLYQRQLGAVPFFLLSIFFFALAVKQLSNRSEGEMPEKEKDHE